MSDQSSGLPEAPDAESRNWALWAHLSALVGALLGGCPRSWDRWSSGWSGATVTRSRYYDNTGNTFDYVYELDGDTLTIGGYESTMTRVDTASPSRRCVRSAL